jgi:uncharacterized membrane protein (UPF0127 family)
MDGDQQQAHPPDARIGEVYHARGMRLLIFAALSCAVVFAACGDGYGDDDPAQTATSLPATAVSTVEATPTIPFAPSGLPLIELSYGDGALQVEVAATLDARRVGLGGRESMAEDAGMLFDLGETRVPSFGMRDMQFALDFIWITEDQRVQGVIADVQPVGIGDPPGAYVPTDPVRYVLEVNGGTAERLGIEPGDQLEFELP